MWKIVLLLFFLLPLNSCSTAQMEPPPALEYISLPEPILHGEKSLEEVLFSRRSARQFSAEEMDWQTVGQLLWAAQGITSPDGKRTAPSAGALYPLQVYYFWQGGWGRYIPQGHKIEKLGREDLRAELSRAALNQEWVKQAPAVFLIGAQVEKTTIKYGDRGERYAILEAGHAAQNLLLEAAALNLAAVPVGSFEDRILIQIIRTDLLPLYLLPVGYPAE